MNIHRVPHLLYPLIVLAFLIESGAGLAAMEARSSAQIVNANALLRLISRDDPQKAIDLAAEARQVLAAVEQGNGDRNPKLHFRGALQDAPQPQPADGEILMRNRKDFDENPILREIYSHSPLASLRMLKRLREATKKNN